MQPLPLKCCTSAAQCGSPRSSVLVLPSTTKPRFARVMATFIRRQSQRKPTCKDRTVYELVGAHKPLQVGWKFP